MLRAAQLTTKYLLWCIVLRRLAPPPSAVYTIGAGMWHVDTLVMTPSAL